MAYDSEISFRLPPVLPAMEFLWDCVVCTSYQELRRVEGWPFLVVINTLQTDNQNLQLKSSNVRQYTKD